MYCVWGVVASLGDEKNIGLIVDPVWCLKLHQFGIGL